MYFEQFEGHGNCSSAFHDLLDEFDPLCKVKSAFYSTSAAEDMAELSQSTPFREFNIWCSPVWNWSFAQQPLPTQNEAKVQHVKSALVAPETTTFANNLLAIASVASDIADQQMKHASGKPYAGRKKAQFFCGFCKRNGESPEVYNSHACKNLDGTCACPILRKHICELCGGTGANAHTRSYCPIAAAGRSLSLMTNSTNRSEFFSSLALKRKCVLCKLFHA